MYIALFQQVTAVLRKAVLFVHLSYVDSRRWSLCSAKKYIAWGSEVAKRLFGNSL